VAALAPTHLDPRAGCGKRARGQLQRPVSARPQQHMLRAPEYSPHRLSALHTARGSRRYVSAAAAKEGSLSGTGKEEHKIFDEVVITVKSGRGGDGEISQAGGGKTVANLKYNPGGMSAKKIWVPNSEPAAGADGGHVVIRVDPHVDSLTHLHSKQVYTAPGGSNGNPATGSGGPKSRKTRMMYANKTKPLEILVPPGTEVRKKRGNWLLGELLQPGDSLVVARGGKGGLGVVAPSREQKIRRAAKAQKRADEEGYEEVIVEDINWKQDSRGENGESQVIRLVLRVVADVGIVGLPNAGKSSLLAAMTRASPDIAPYPFTTLMPNLGVLSAGQGAPVLADLPGLIEGAHEGRGLGFMFLRHLRRTRVLMHVVDAAEADPIMDYFVVREELRMYNPQYTARPHIVVLNKMDMEDAYELEDELRAGITAVSKKLEEENDGHPSVPTAIISTSAVDGKGIDDLHAAINEALGVKDDGNSLGLDPEVLEALKADGFDVDNLDFSNV